MLLSGMLLLPLLAGAQTTVLLKGMQSSDVMKSATDAVGGSLPALLESQLGISTEQAEGGLGSILSLAQERLNAGDFDQLAAFIPGAAGYIEAAKSLGAVTGPLKNMAGLNDALGALGISPDTASSFVPTVTDYLGKIGGDDAGKLLQAALGSG